MYTEYSHEGTLEERRLDVPSESLVGYPEISDSNGRSEARVVIEDLYNNTVE